MIQQKSECEGIGGKSTILGYFLADLTIGNDYKYSVNRVRFDVINSQTCPTLIGQSVLASSALSGLSYDYLNRTVNFIATGDTAVVVDLKNNETVTGMVAGESELKLILITVSGERMELDKNDIVERRVSQISIMPEDLIDTMGLNDLVNLFAFLERGSDI